MSEVAPKPPEVRQAQIAAFISENISNPIDGRYAFHDLGNIALGNADYISDRAEDDDAGREPPKASEIIATADDYRNFLRSVGGANYEGIKVRAELLTAYSEFVPDVMQIKDELANLANPQEHPNFLGKGYHSAAFVISRQGKPYVVRIPHGRDADPLTTDSHVSGAVLGRGMPHLEQIVAASYEDGVTVAEKVPGKEWGRVSLEEAKGVTAEQLADLVDTVIEANRRGIAIDIKLSNLLYDVDYGYSLIDYSSNMTAVRHVRQDQRLPVLLSRLAESIAQANAIANSDSHERTAEAYERDVAFAEANLVVLAQYREAVATKLEDEDRIAALQQIDRQSQELQKIVSNPNWVKESLKRDRELDM